MRDERTPLSRNLLREPQELVRRLNSRPCFGLRDQGGEPRVTSQRLQVFIVRHVGDVLRPDIGGLAEVFEGAGAISGDGRAAGEAVPGRSQRPFAGRALRHLQSFLKKIAWQRRAAGKIKSVQSFLVSCSCSSLLSRELERFSDHFFTFLPECFGVVRVERITAHTFADRGDSHIIWRYFAHMAVRAILSAYLASRRNHRGPY
jgi:hypothetical protein